TNPMVTLISRSRLSAQTGRAEEKCERLHINLSSRFFCRLMHLPVTHLFISCWRDKSLWTSQT
ncbi:MAG: hypothetical protein WCJ56_08235, partial [bacterium]